MRSYTAGDALGQTQEVRDHAFNPAGEHLSGPAEAGSNLVGYEQDAVFFREPPDLLQEARRGDYHARGPPEHGLYDAGRYLSCALLQYIFKCLEALRLALGVV